MKKLIKKILGDYIIFRILDIMERYLPVRKMRDKREAYLKDFNNRKAFYSNFIKENDLCFDIGANMGNRVGPLLAIGAKVVAVEPQKSCYRVLKYKFGDKIEIVRKGLAENEGIKEMHISDSNVISSFSEEWINSVKDGRFKEYRWYKIVKVEMTTLDKLIVRFGQPAFIKIDVEGYELEVLRGLSKPIKMISFEYTVPEQISRISECIDWIEKNEKKIECNYSIGESMVITLDSWLSAEEMKKYINTEEFIETGFGDIYVRIKN